MTLNRYLFVFFSTCFVLASQRSLGTNELTGLTVTSRPIDGRVVSNLLAAYDAGDGYMGAKGRRSLLRLPNALSVRVDRRENSRAKLAALTASGGALAGFAVEVERKDGFALLRSEASQSKSPAAAASDLATVRQSPGIVLVNPVFIEPTSGLWAMTTDEIIVALKPGVDAQSYFGADWARVRPLIGSQSQFLLTLPSAESEAVFAAAEQHAADPRVAWAEPDFISQGLSHLIPNDPEFVNQWHLRNTGQTGGTAGADIRATTAWDRTNGSRSVIIAVLDSGFDLAHPDLVSNLATNAQEIAGNGLDDDGNGYTDDVRGWDFYAPDNDANPNTAFDNHGTICAGAAAAAGNNAIGVTGVAYGCRWMPLRIGESINAGQFSSRDSDIAAAIYYAAGGVNQSDSWRGADVLSLSFESFQATVVDNAITFATEQAHNGQGVPIFVATGNHGDGWQTIILNGFPSGTFTFAWTYSKNAANAAGEDAVWLAQVNFPGGTIERFDGATFPPAGWTTSGNASWTRPSDPAHSYGVNQLIPRSGAIGDNQSTTLQTTRTIGAGSMTYVFWVSSEAGADIFSFSLNGTHQAVDASGVPFIRSGPSYPGTHPNVITVGASTHWDTRASYSQVGGKLDFLATGGGSGGASTLTTDRTGTSGYNTAASPGGDYYGADGTSLATPVATGVGALMLSVAPNLTAFQVRDILRTTADKVGPVPYTNGWNAYYGAGRINASNALAVAAASNCNGAPAIVNNLSDSGAGSLRDAIQRINNGCSTSIVFTASGTINLASSLPLITRSAVISGPGTNQLTINGGGAYSLFQFGPNTTNRITGVRLVNGFSINAASAVWNRGQTIIDSCVFSSNVTVGVLGGAIGNFSANPGDGALFVTNCTFFRNVCLGQAGESRSAGNNGGPGGGGAGMGGAIYSEGRQLVLSGCNFDANVAGGGNGGNGDANGFGNDTGGNGGSPNGGVGGAAGLPGSDGGFGGGGGGGAGSFNVAGQPGGVGGFGGGGGGGGARGGGGDGGTGGGGGIYGGSGGVAFASHSGGGGGGAGLGGAVFARTGAVVIASCNFSANRATNGVGGVGSFGGGNGGPGQGRGGALFGLDAIITGVNLTFTGNLASTASPEVEVPTVVTTTSDDGLGSLRQAIRNAALRPGADTITFAPSLSGSVVSLTTAQLDVTDAGPLTVSAAGLPAGIGITGNGARRAFEVFGGATLTLDSLTLFNCFSSFGGAVINSGDLSVRNCTIVSNLAEYVGAIYNLGGSSTLSVHSSTIANNSATNLDGGIFSYGPLEIRHSTIVNNRATNAGGGVRFSAAAILEHNIIAGNSSPFDPDLGDFGVLNGLARYNFVGDGSGSTLVNGVNGNRVGTPGSPLNPQLSALKYFGGPTAVLHPLPGSPVIDAGDPALAGVISDQRGWPRLSGGRVDIGAVEYAPAAGYSVLFDGVNDFLVLSNAAVSLPTNEVTVEFWERVATVREQFSFILFPDVTTDRFAFSSVRINGTTYWDFGDLFNSGRLAYNGAAGSIINQWTHWAVVSSQASNSMRIYRNGKLDASSSTNRSFVRYAAALVLGARLDAGGQEFFQGEIDEFRIWSVARTQTEIQSAMNFGLCPPQTNLWVYWKFNEPSGDIVYDYSGNNRHGLLFNGVTRAISLAPLYPPGTATMTLLNSSQVQVSWLPNSGCLESAHEVTGPWTAVSGATNGQTISTSLDRQFFRVSQ